MLTNRIATLEWWLTLLVCLRGCLPLGALAKVVEWTGCLADLSNGTGASDDDRKARGIAWILFEFYHIWVFALRSPSSGKVPFIHSLTGNIWKCARPFIFLWVRAWHSGCAWSVADFFALVLLLLTCSTVNSFSADIRSLADYISKLEKCYFRYGYSFAIMHQEFIDKIQNDLCNYEKLLVLFVWKLTSSRTSGHIKHNFCTINFHSSCFFSCFSASSNEK